MAKATIEETNTNLSVQVLAQNEIAGYAVIPDLLEQPGLLLKTSMERDIYSQGQLSLRYYTLSTLVIGISFCVLTLGFLRWLVLSRLGRLSYQVNQIGISNHHDVRVQLSGNDELSRLAQTIDWTLEQISHRTNELELAKQPAEAAKEAAESAEETANAANAAKSVFLANMSHELRTPLNVIIGFAQILRRDQTLQPQQQEKLNIINRSSDHLLSLINDVLDMAKIEAGHTELNLQNFDLHHLLNNLADLFSLRANAKGFQ